MIWSERGTCRVQSAETLSQDSTFSYYAAAPECPGDPQMTRKARIFLSALAVCAATGAAAAAGQSITSGDLLDGLTNPSRWLTYSGDYTGQRFGPLTQITLRIQLSWSRYGLPDRRRKQI